MVTADSISILSINLVPTSSGEISGTGSLKTSRRAPTWRCRAIPHVAASFADIDNDGDADLFVTTVNMGNVLFENMGDGRFRDIWMAGLEHSAAIPRGGVF